MGKLVRLIAAGSIATMAGTSSMTAATQQVVVVTGNSGGCGTNCNPYGASYTNGPSYSGSNSNIPESEAFANLVNEAKKIADAVVSQFESPCVISNESPSAYVTRAAAACVAHVIDKLPGLYPAMVKLTASTLACRALDAEHAVKVSNPSANDICKG